MMAIVVVNFGSHALIERNLAAVELDHSLALVVLVDNYTTQCERTAVRQLTASRGWVLVELEHNRGFGAGMNAGMAEARTRGCVCFLLLNPDAVIDVNVIAELRAHCLRDPLALISSRIETSDGSIVFQGSELQISTGRIRGLRNAHEPHDGSIDAALVSQFVGGGVQPWLAGACLALHSDLLDRVGGFDEPYFLYWEDVDLSFRVHRAGGSLVVRHDLVVVHDEGGTQGARRGNAKSNLYYYYNCRNRLLFAAGHLSRRDVFRWVVRTPTESWQILLRGGRRQLVQSPGPLLAALHGSLAGVGIALKGWATNRTAVASCLRPGGPTPSGLIGQSILVAHPSAELYGSDRVLLESVSALTGAGARVVVALPSAGPLVAELAKRGATVEFCPTPVLRKSALRPRGFAALLLEAMRGLRPALGLLRRSGAGVVYVNTTTIPAWLVLGKLSGRRVVCHVHEAERTQPLAVRRLMALPAICADRLIVNSEFSRGVLVAASPRLARRSTVVYNGVPGPTVTEAGRHDLTGPVQLLFVGRLSPRKGPRVLISALGELIARGIDAELTLLGSVYPGYEWFEQELRESVKEAGLDARVRFAGFDADVWPHVAAADIVLIPSMLDEPFGNTAVEAVLAARPLVASSTSGLIEAAQSYACAQLVEPGSPHLWADAVQQVIARWPWFRDRAHADSVLARLRHSPQRYRDDIAAIVTSIVERPS